MPRRQRGEGSVYPCAGECFTDPRAAEEYILRVRTTATGRLVDPPYAYFCAAGHWHAHVRFA